MLYSAKAGLLLILISSTLHLYGLIKSFPVYSGLWQVILLFLGLKILFQAAGLLPTGIWPGEHGLRILYLHLVLLGFGSAALLAAYYPASERLAKWFYIAAACSVLVTLGMVSGYWPALLTPGSMIYWLAGAALLPVLPMIWLSFRKM